MIQVAEPRHEADKIEDYYTQYHTKTEDHVIECIRSGLLKEHLYTLPINSDAEQD